MARVAFFTETLPPDSDPISDFSFELMRGLAEQQHGVKIFSTYRPDQSVPRLPARIEALFPFRNWSWLEIPRVLPILLQFQPEILHVIQPRREALRGLTNAMTAVASLASLSPASPLLGRPSLVSSFYDLRESDWRAHRGIIALSSAITVSTQSQLELMNDWVGRLNQNKNDQSRMTATQNFPKISLVPIPMSAHADFNHGMHSESSSVDHAEFEEIYPLAQMGDPFPEGVSRFISRYTKFVWVPGTVSSHIDPSILFQTLSEVLEQVADVGVIIGGEWGSLSTLERRSLMRSFENRGVGSRVMIAGALSSSAELALLKTASAIFLASLPTESLHLARIERLALQTNSILIMTSLQAEMDPLAWRDRETAFISEASPGEWGRTLYAALTDVAAIDTVRSRLPDFARSEAVDQPGNVVSRIYARLLQTNANGAAKF